MCAQVLGGSGVALEGTRVEKRASTAILVAVSVVVARAKFFGVRSLVDGLASVFSELHVTHFLFCS